MGATIGEVFLNRLIITHGPVPLTPAQLLAKHDNQAIERGYCYRTTILPKRFKDRQLPVVYGYGRTIQAAMDNAGSNFIERCIKLKPERTRFEYETATYTISPRLAAEYQAAYQSEPLWDYTDPLIEEIILNYRDDLPQNDLAYNTPYWDDQPFSQ